MSDGREEKIYIMGGKKKGKKKKSPNFSISFILFRPVCSSKSISDTNQTTFFFLSPPPNLHCISYFFFFFFIRLDVDMNNTCVGNIQPQDRHFKRPPLPTPTHPPPKKMFNPQDCDTKSTFGKQLLV